MPSSHFLAAWLLALFVGLAPASAKSASREKFSDTAAASSEIAAQLVEATEENCLWYDEIASGASHYNYFRDYNPQTGRYQQSDPAGMFDGPNIYAYAGSSPLLFQDFNGESRSRAGRSQKLRDIRDDDKQSSCVRGWLVQEQNHILRGGRGKGKTKYVRLPPGHDLAHPGDAPSCQGNSYKNTCMQNEQVHDIQTRHERARGRYGRR